MGSGSLEYVPAGILLVICKDPQQSFWGSLVSENLKLGVLSDTSPLPAASPSKHLGSTCMPGTAKALHGKPGCLAEQAPVPCAVTDRRMALVHL